MVFLPAWCGNVSTPARPIAGRSLDRLTGKSPRVVDAKTGCGSGRRDKLARVHGRDRFTRQLERLEGLLRRLYPLPPVRGRLAELSYADAHQVFAGRGFAALNRGDYPD